MEHIGSEYICIYIYTYTSTYIYDYICILYIYILSQWLTHVGPVLHPWCRQIRCLSTDPTWIYFCFKNHPFLLVDILPSSSLSSSTSSTSLSSGASASTASAMWTFPNVASSTSVQVNVICPVKPVSNTTAQRSGVQPPYSMPKKDTVEQWIPTKLP